MPNTSKSSADGADVWVDGINLTQRFRCLGCGSCCTGDGWVRVSREQEVEIAAHLSLPLSDFRKKYVEWTDDRGAVFKNQEGVENACIFLTAERRCSIHTVKPEQCRTFPYAWRTDRFTSDCAGFVALKREDEATS